MHIESVSGFPTDPWLESETSKVPPASRLVRVNWIRIAPGPPGMENQESGGLRGFQRRWRQLVRSTVMSPSI